MSWLMPFPGHLRFPSMILSIGSKDYIKQHLPSQKVAYHGAWYQSVIPELYLTVTWGTMDKQQMVIKDLYGVREDKSFFIEKIL
ncbi:hypothetical protein Q2T40_01270 [Winogradskyella maritima]|nr:hypothetical protein [Winogradskyella maritima]